MWQPVTHTRCSKTAKSMCFRKTGAACLGRSRPWAPCWWTDSVPLMAFSSITSSHHHSRSFFLASYVRTTSKFAYSGRVIVSTWLWAGVAREPRGVSSGLMGSSFSYYSILIGTVYCLVLLGREISGDVFTKKRGSHSIENWVEVRKKPSSCLLAFGMHVGLLSFLSSRRWQSTSTVMRS